MGSSMGIESDGGGPWLRGEQSVAEMSIHSSPTALPIRSHLKKRRAGEFIAPTGPPPPKRAKGEFNATYLSLLNQDIQDASTRLVHAGEAVELDDAQIGAVTWRAAEKQSFFAAVSRLGSNDAAGISARIGSKSDVEVRQYLRLLDARRQRQRNKRRTLKPIDIPAAMEIGAECAAALEAAADVVSLYQESYEEEVERERWGGRWLVTASLAQALEEMLRSQPLPRFSETPTPQPQSQSRERGRRVQQLEEKQQQEQRWGEDERPREQSRRKGEDPAERDGASSDLPFLQLFRVRNWLQLSDRIFMNSAVSDGNWHAFLEEPGPPAIRATAFADFHRLAVSITRRLLVATIYVTEYRLRMDPSRQHANRHVKHVKAVDVMAAVSSLGMRQHSRESWARCARRLRLNVVDDGGGEDEEEFDNDGFTDEEYGDADAEGSGNTDYNDDDQQSSINSEADDADDAEQEADESEEDDDIEFMAYDEVEAALGYPVVNNSRGGYDTNELYASTPSATEPEQSREDEDEYEGEGENEEEEEAETNDEIEQEDERPAKYRQVSDNDDDDDYNPEDDDEDEEEDINMEDRQEETGDHERELLSEDNHDYNNDEEGLDADAVQRDVEEAILSSSLTLPNRHRRAAITSRIRVEHRLERDAERLDAQASADAETELWAVLRGENGPKGEITRDRKV